MIDSPRLSYNGAARLRFRPPQLVPNQSVLWAVQRAFGPPGSTFAALSDPQEGIRTARRLDLAPRIAFRISRGTLESELGSAEAATLTADRGLYAMAADRLLETARKLSAAGERLALLKGSALFACSIVAPGSRALADLDVLVEERQLGSWADRLRGLGFAEVRGSVPSDHQLAPFARHGVIVELHRFLPGVRVSGARGFATFEALEQAGLLEGLSGWPDWIFTPRPPVLAAHAAVHGLAQHGFAPRSYPLTRMLADLIDLGVHTNPVLAEQAHVLVAKEIPREEWDELLDTCGDLERGAAVHRPLLAHAVLGLLDDDYAVSLKLRALGAVPSTLPKALVIAREAWRALFPGRARLAGLHPGGIGLALKRPFAMFGRGLLALRVKPRR